MATNTQSQESAARSLTLDRSSGSRPGALQWVLVLLPLGYLWFRLLNNLRFEWTTNPQYSYGLVVPFLAVGLLLRRWQGIRRIEGPRAEAGCHRSVVLLLAMFAFLYLPTRLVEEATPEWRPVEWMLGIEAVGLTMGAIYLMCGPMWAKELAVPICFLLVSVPWPTVFESPLIQGLSRFNAAMVVEVLGLLGVPAIQHGNVIEVSTGNVGINDACSGIRSFQSSLMVSVFVGEFLRLTLFRRFLLVPIGFALAILFNLSRASLLAFLAATQGLEAISRYHDSAGLTILLACTGATWGLALLFRKGDAHQHASPSAARDTDKPNLSKGRLPRFALRPLFLCLLTWFLMVEAGVWLWYRIRESHIPSGPEWTMVLPTGNSTYRELPMADVTRGLLRFDEGKQGAWKEPDGTEWQAFYFNWLPGRVSSYLAKRHTPDICLPAAGCTLRSGPKLILLTINGVELPVRHYIFDSQRGPIQAFQCRWEAGVSREYYTEQESSRFNLLRGIWAGRGIHGQKVIEIIITGVSDQEEATKAVTAQLRSLIRVEGSMAESGNESADRPSR